MRHRHGENQWSIASIGVKTVGNGAFRPISFDEQHRRVPATLGAVSAAGGWVAFTGPDLDLMYADPANRGRIYVTSMTKDGVRSASLVDLVGADWASYPISAMSIDNSGQSVAFTLGPSHWVWDGGSTARALDGPTSVYGPGDHLSLVNGDVVRNGVTISRPVAAGLTHHAYSAISSGDGSRIYWAQQDWDPERPDLPTYWTIWKRQGKRTDLMYFAAPYSAVTAVSATGEWYAQSAPWGADRYGFMTVAGSMFRHDQLESVDCAVDIDGFPLSERLGNVVTGISRDGSRVSIATTSARTFVVDRTGEKPPTLLVKTRAGAWGSNYEAWAADPVSTGRGDLVLAETDAALPSVGASAVLGRYYSSETDAVGRMGRGWIDTFAASLSHGSDDRVAVTTPDGSVLTFLRVGQVWRPESPAIHATLLALSSGWRLTSMDGTRVLFDADGKLTGVQDSAGRGVAVTWEGQTQIVTTSAGQRLELSVESGHLVSARLPDGSEVRYGYTSGLLTSVTDEHGATTRYTYDDGRLVSEVDANGDTQFVTTYDPATGRVVAQADATGAVTTISWDPDSETATVTGPTGDIWTDVYRGGLLMWRSEPGGKMTDFAYDGELNVTTMIDGSQRRTSVVYDALGRPTSVTWPDRSTTRYAFSTIGALTSSTDASGATRSYRHDAAGNVVSVTDVDGRERRVVRDPATGLPVREVSPAGRVTRFTHDAAGNLTAVTSPAGRTTSLTYDARGRLTSVVTPHARGADAADYTWTVERAGRTTRLVDPSGGALTSRVDAVGQVVERVDQLGRTTRYGYDAAHQLVSVTDPMGATTAYEYDARGWVSGKTDGNGHRYAYSATAGGQPAQVVDPTGGTWTYRRNAAGGVQSVTDPLGQGNPSAGTISFGFDDLGRLGSTEPSRPQPPGDGGPAVASFVPSAATIVTTELNAIASARGAAGTDPYLPDPSPATYVSRDDSGRVTGLDQGSHGSVGYDRDPAGRLLSATYEDGRRVAYEWDDDDLLVATTGPTGVRTTRTYDADGHVTSVTSGASTTSYEYDATGALRRTTFADGTVETRTRDLLGRVVAMVTRDADGQVLAKQTYVYDAVGNPVVTTDRGRTTYRVYDARDQLVHSCSVQPCTEATAGVHETYDAVGNRVAHEDAAGRVTTYTHDAGDRIASVTGPNGHTRRLVHDSAGRLLRDGGSTYRYDVRGRLTTVTGPQGEVTYTYAADGTLRTRTTGGVTTTYTWNTAGGIPALVHAEVAGADSVAQVDFVQGATAPAEIVVDGRALTVHTDRQGSVTTLTEGGAVSATARYEAFGARTAATAPELDAVMLGFQGQLTDPVSGLVLMGARAYDPDLGRFTTIDPIGVDAARPSVNPYAFVDNRPTVFVDPTGLRAQALADDPIGPLREVNDGLERWGTILDVATAVTLLPPLWPALPVVAYAGAVVDGAGTVTQVIVSEYDIVHGNGGLCAGLSSLADFGIGGAVEHIARGALPDTVEAPHGTGGRHAAPYSIDGSTLARGMSSGVDSDLMWDRVSPVC